MNDMIDVESSVLVYVSTVLIQYITGVWCNAAIMLLGMIDG